MQTPSIGKQTQTNNFLLLFGSIMKEKKDGEMDTDTTAGTQE